MDYAYICITDPFVKLFAQNLLYFVKYTDGKKFIFVTTFHSQNVLEPLPATFITLIYWGRQNVDVTIRRTKRHTNKHSAHWALHLHVKCLIRVTPH
jgi:hypothetical protein